MKKVLAIDKDRIFLLVLSGKLKNSVNVECIISFRNGEIDDSINEFDVVVIGDIENLEDGIVSFGRNIREIFDNKRPIIAVCSDIRKRRELINAGCCTHETTKYRLEGKLLEVLNL